MPFGLAFDSMMVRQRGETAVFIRIAMFVLLLPTVADAQFSLNATELGFGAEQDGPTHAGTCGKDACRATLPVKLGGDVCILNIRVGAPAAEGWGSILFAAGPCRSGRMLVVKGYPASTGYVPDRFGAATLAFDVPFQSAKWANLPDGWDDAVVHEAARVRLDIVAVKLP
jgi:hypothetical protein